MTSSKKKRGKQRKAAKLAAASRDGDGRMQNNRSQQQSELEMSSTGDGMQEINRSERHQVVTSVLRGGADATKYLSEITPRRYESMAAASAEGLLFENSGILSFVLDALKLCENTTFDKVMATLSLRGGGDLTSPSTWIKVLLKAHQFEPRCRLQIAQNIGPLVSCMCIFQEQQTLEAIYLAICGTHFDFDMFRDRGQSRCP